MFRLCFLLTTITVSLLFSDFCFNYVMRIKGIYWPDRPLDIIKNVLLPKERQVETNKYEYTESNGDGLDIQRLLKTYQPITRR